MKKASVNKECSINSLNSIKWYGVVLGIITLALQHAIYLLANEIAQLVGITPFLPKIPVIDNAIHIVPIFIIPYIWSYAYWAMAPMAVSKCEHSHFLDYLASYMFACLFGAVILIFAPSYMNRVAEGLLDTSKKGVLYDLMRLWYSMDGGKMAYNLFPSFHCINSTISYLGVRKRHEIPKWFRVYSLVTTILIYMSTLFVKQHYFIDVLAGIAIGVASFCICKKYSVGKIFNKPIQWLKKLASRQ